MFFSTVLFFIVFFHRILFLFSGRALKDSLMEKFGCSLPTDVFTNRPAYIHPPQLFLALQYHTGLSDTEASEIVL